MVVPRCDRHRPWSAAARSHRIASHPPGAVSRSRGSEVSRSLGLNNRATPSPRNPATATLCHFPQRQIFYVDFEKQVLRLAGIALRKRLAPLGSLVIRIDLQHLIELQDGIG